MILCNKVPHLMNKKLIVDSVHFRVPLVQKELSNNISTQLFVSGANH
jgi:hypothetical protein